MVYFLLINDNERVLYRIPKPSIVLFVSTGLLQHTNAQLVRSCIQMNVWGIGSKELLSVVGLLASSSMHKLDLWLHSTRTVHFANSSWELNRVVTWRHPVLSFFSRNGNMYTQSVHFCLLLLVSCLWNMREHAGLILIQVFGILLRSGRRVWGMRVCRFEARFEVNTR